MNATLAPSHLTAADRCDRCGAQAYVRVTLASGGEPAVLRAPRTRARGRAVRCLGADPRREREAQPTPANAAEGDR
nr:hypothetical protein [Angustibacter aerolatus]